MKEDEEKEEEEEDGDEVEEEEEASTSRLREDSLLISEGFSTAACSFISRPLNLTDYNTQRNPN